MLPVEILGSNDEVSSEQEVSFKGQTVKNERQDSDGEKAGVVPLT